MISFAPINLPALTADGVPIKVARERWRLQANLNKGLLTATSPSATLTFAFSAVLAVWVTSQDEVRATGKTIQRMFLTGAAAEMMSRGRDSGFGAGLLDLSLRGAETRTKVGGVLVWPDLSTVQFSAVGDELERFSALIPSYAFEAERLEHASEMIGLVARMKEDGLRALHELADEIFALSARARSMLGEAERGDTFEQRDRARQSARAIEAELDAKRSICSALMNECGVPARELIPQTTYTDATFAELLGNRVSTNTMEQPEEDEEPYDGHGLKVALTVVGMIAVVFFAVWLFGH